MTKEGEEAEDRTIERHHRRHGEDLVEVDKKTYVYKDSGIFERQGYIPYWLIIVSVALAVWAVVYMFFYWDEPG